eukprot:2942436-Pyramimonas_sp.AAC.1
MSRLLHNGNEIRGPDNHMHHDWPMRTTWIVYQNLRLLQEVLDTIRPQEKTTVVDFDSFVYN